VGLDFLTWGWLYAAPGLVSALVILYFLKLKRVEVRIGSTYLWRRAIDDMRVNSPLQRLRMNILLLLQLLALLLLILALARPVANLGGLKGKDTILLLDVSASMQATDGAAQGTKTRLERAVEEAQRVVGDLSRGDRATVVTFAEEAQVLTPMTGSKATLRAALESIKPTDRGTRLDAALHRVRAILDDGQKKPDEFELYVFTDGRVGPLEGVALDARVPLHYVKLGRATENVGIVGLDVRPPAVVGDATRIFVTLANTGTAGVEVGVDVRRTDPSKPLPPPGKAGAKDAGLFGSKSVKLPPSIDKSKDDPTQRQKPVVVTIPFEANLEAGAGVQMVQVSLDHLGGADALPADDVAWGLLRPQEPIRLLLVTPGNLFLDSALKEDPLVWKDGKGRIPVLEPEGFAALSPDKLAEYDLIVLDRTSPRTLPPGNYLCFAALPPFPGLDDLGSMNDWKVLDWDEAHDVARFVNFGTLVLPTGQKLKPRDGDTEIVRANHGPLVLEAKDGDRRAIIVAFDLMSLPLEGAWTFDPSYPIFLANVVRYLGGGGKHRKDELLVRTGGVAELRFPATSALATITPPKDGGAPYDIKIRSGDELLRVATLDHAGIYKAELKAEGKKEPLRTTFFAANLADVDESTIAPVKDLVVAGKKVVGDETAEESNQDMWKWAAIAALVLIMIEWWVYNRRTYL
jgi:hypothetical protein